VVVSVLLVISRMSVANTFAACLSAFTYVPFGLPDVSATMSNASVCRSISAHTSAAVAVLKSSASSDWTLASPLVFLFFALGRGRTLCPPYPVSNGSPFLTVELLLARVRLLCTSGGRPKWHQGQVQILVAASARDFLPLLFLGFFLVLI
jgi:hypothetical protein